MPRVSAQILKGTRDLLPERTLLRHFVIDILKETFEQFGFEPLETPAIEYAATLEGKFGEEGEKLMYKFQDPGGRRVALRYDLTVPLARVVAMHPELVKPFKRYQIAPVWRAEKPQKGRYREFWQCDADTVGSASMLADAEVLALTYTALMRLGFRRFTIKINHRKLLMALAQYAGVPQEKAGGLYRAIDKLEKQGPASVERELIQEGLAPPVVARLLDLLAMGGTAEALERLRENLAALALGREGIAELQELVGHLEHASVPAESYRLDFAMVRGLDYYTGPIFETVVEEPQIGSVSGGGRYDKLVGLFGAQEFPATGVSFGLERIIDVMEELAMRPAGLGKTVTQVLVTVFDAPSAAASLHAATELRAQGFKVEVYLGTERLGHQLRYASRKGIPLVVILGPDEIAAGQVTVKNLATGGQERVSRAGLAEKLSSFLAPPAGPRSWRSEPQKDIPPGRR